MNGINCDKWTYYMLDGSKEQYAFWMQQDTAIPVATGRVKNPSSPTSLYTIFFSNFSAQAPPETFFYPEEGVLCPESIDPAMYDADTSSKRDHANFLMTFPRSLTHMHELAAARRLQ